jgi:hypothetical protein
MAPIIKAILMLIMLMDTATTGLSTSNIGAISKTTIVKVKESRKEKIMNSKEASIKASSSRVITSGVIKKIMNFNIMEILMLTDNCMEKVA